MCVGGGGETRRTEEDVGRQHQGMDGPGVRQVPEGSGEQGKMEKTGCKIICGAPTTLPVKGLMMIMVMMIVQFYKELDVCVCVCVCMHVCVCVCVRVCVCVCMCFLIYKNMYSLFSICDQTFVSTEYKAKLQQCQLLHFISCEKLCALQSKSKLYTQDFEPSLKACKGLAALKPFPLYQADA